MVSHGSKVLIVLSVARIDTHHLESSVPYCITSNGFYFLMSDSISYNRKNRGQVINGIQNGLLGKEDVGVK